MDMDWDASGPGLPECGPEISHPQPGMHLWSGWYQTEVQGALGWAVGWGPSDGSTSGRGVWSEVLPSVCHLGPCYQVVN